MFFVTLKSWDSLAKAGRNVPHVFWNSRILAYYLHLLFLLKTCINCYVTVKLEIYLKLVVMNSSIFLQFPFLAKEEKKTIELATPTVSSFGNLLSYYLYYS